MLEIRESQIEDIFATQIDDVKKLLSVDGSIALINRQKELPSGGILDLLFLSSNNLLLLELRIFFYNEEMLINTLYYAPLRGRNRKEY